MFFVFLLRMKILKKNTIKAAELLHTPPGRPGIAKLSRLSNWKTENLRKVPPNYTAFVTITMIVTRLQLGGENCS